MKRLIVILFVLCLMTFQPSRAYSVDCDPSDYTCAEIEVLLDYINAYGATIGAAEVDADVATQAELDAVKDRAFLALSFDNGAAAATFTAANMLLYGTINNQGADEETDIILVTPTFPIKFEVEVSEDHVIELCPAAGEIFDLNGTDLHADDCVNSSAVVGDWFVVKSRQIAAGTWQYFIDTGRGVHIDAGAAD